MFQNLSHSTTVTPTNDNNLTRMRMNMQNYVREHLVVKKLVPLSQLYNIIKDKHSSKIRILDNLYLLKLALADIEDFLNVVSILNRRIGSLFEKFNHLLLFLYIRIVFGIENPLNSEAYETV